MRHALSHFSLDNPEQIMYKSASWAIRIDFEQRLVAADSLQKQPSGVSATRAADRALAKPGSHDFATAQRYDRIALAAESDSVRALFGDDSLCVSGFSPPG
jgi:hypothetical protein